MSTLAKLRAEIADLLNSWMGLPELPVIDRRAKDIAGDVDAALGKLGLCIYVMPVLPKTVTEGHDAIFIESAEVRVRVLEMPTLNSSGMDLYDALTEVMLCLHGSNPGELLADKLRLDNPPVAITEDPQVVIADAVFRAVLHLEH